MIQGRCFHPKSQGAIERLNHFVGQFIEIENVLRAYGNSHNNNVHTVTRQKPNKLILCDDEKLILEINSKLSSYYQKKNSSLKKIRITSSTSELSITENSVKIDRRLFNFENVLDKLMIQSKAQAIVEKARKAKEEESTKKENIADEENTQEIQAET